MSRTRLIRPEFFADETVASLTIPSRLFYIGLWTLCDDEGYFENRPRQMAAELFRYDSVKRREKIVVAALEELVGTERVKMLDCGDHGVVPSIPDHRIKGGEQLFTVQKRHERRCLGAVIPEGRSRGPSGEAKSIHASVREIVLKRDQNLCRYCGKSVLGDHVFEHVSNQGPGTIENIVLACRSCNTKKGTKTVEQAGMTLHLPGYVVPTEDSRRTTDNSVSVSGSVPSTLSVSGSVPESDSLPAPDGIAEPDAADAYYLLTTRFPTDKVLTWLDDLSGRFGTEAVCRGLATAWTAERSPSTLLGRVQDALRSEARKLDRKEADEERERLRQKRLTPRVTPMDLEFREALLKRYEHFGKGAA